MFGRFIKICILTAVSTQVLAGSHHHVFATDDMPQGQFRDRVKKLPPMAQQRVMDLLNRFHIPAADYPFLKADGEGAVLYVDSNTEDEPSDPGVPAPESGLSAAEVFTLHSNPGASRVIFLDFDGHRLSGTAWNENFNSGADFQAQAYDLDGSPSSFSTEEIDNIAEIWHRVAEDFAAFDVDVTTEEPASFGSTVGRVLITKNVDASGTAMPYQNAGGVAYVGVWGRYDYEYYQPALVYWDNLGNGYQKYVAEAASHEMGHNQGLSHDGTGSENYYTGHGDGHTGWAPIMGVGYYKSVTQWSNGNYPGANNSQDDVDILISNLGTKADDHMDDVNTDSYLFADASGAVVSTDPSTDPHNASPDNKGIISTRTDKDLFRFEATAGTVDLTVTPAWRAYTSERSANLDIRVALLDAAGSELAAVNSSSDTMAALQVDVTAGTYYLAVSGVGSQNYNDYASHGQYYISGSIPAGGETPVNQDPVAADDSYSINEDQSITISVLDNDSDPDGDTLGIMSVTTASLGNVTIIGDQIDYTPSADIFGMDSFTYTISDGNGATATATVNLEIVSVNDAPVAANDQVILDQDSSATVSVLTNDQDIEDDQLSIASVTQPANGSIEVSGTSITYTPSTGFYGSDQFTYTVEDQQGATDIATVTVTVNQVEAPEEPEQPEQPEQPNPALTGFYVNGGMGSATIRWRDISNEIGYEVEREKLSTFTNTWGSKAVITAGANTFYIMNSGLTGGKYRYRVRAILPNSTTEWTDWAEVNVVTFGSSGFNWGF